MGIFRWYINFLIPGFLGDILGEIVGGLFGYSAQEETNYANAQQAANTMAFQERMSGTAHTREVADLRAAGLNPILSATGGPGASSPPGATARFDSPGGEGVKSALAVSTAKNLRQQNEQIQADTRLKDTQRSYTSQQWNTSRAQESLINQQYETEKENTKAASHHAEILSHSAKGAKLEGDIDTTKYGEMMRYIDRAIKSLTGGSSAIRNIKP